MSVAYDLFHEAPQSYARPARPRLRLVAPAGEPTIEPAASARALATGADVRVLHAPRTGTTPLRLTRRGVAVLALAVAAVAVALVWAAASSASSSPVSSSSNGSVGSAATVTVRQGDTLWSIAGRVAPTRDPRAEVDLLRRVNHLAGVDLEPGQVLTLH